MLIKTKSAKFMNLNDWNSSYAKLENEFVDISEKKIVATIYAVPNEILALIFKFARDMNIEDLKAIRLSCKRWREIVDLHKDLKLNIDKTKLRPTSNSNIRICGRLQITCLESPIKFLSLVAFLILVGVFGLISGSMMLNYALLVKNSTSTTCKVVGFIDNQDTSSNSSHCNIYVEFEFHDIPKVEELRDSIYCELNTTFSCSYCGGCKPEKIFLDKHIEDENIQIGITLIGSSSLLLLLIAVISLNLVSKTSCNESNVI